MWNWKRSAAAAIVAGAALGLGSAGITGSAWAAQPPGDKKPAAPSDKKDAQPPKKEGGPPAGMPELTPEQKRAMNPGPEHKVLDALLGTWEGEVSMWMAPGTEPQKMKGSATREWSLDGRFMMEHVKGLPDGENPFRALGIVGYNGTEKRYESVWMENMSTAIVFGTGQYDAAKKTLTFKSEFTHPMTGQKIKQRDVLDMSNPDRHTMQGFSTPPDGKEYKSFEGVFEKKTKK